MEMARAVEGLPGMPRKTVPFTREFPPSMKAPVVENFMIGGPPIMKFSTTGAFIDGGNSLVNGTVFLGIPGKPSTARAISILGATGRVREYHWDGTQWQE